MAADQSQNVQRRRNVTLLFIADFIDEGIENALCDQANFNLGTGDRPNPFRDIIRGNLCCLKDAINRSDFDRIGPTEMSYSPSGLDL